MFPPRTMFALALSCSLLSAASRAEEPPPSAPPQSPAGPVSAPTLDAPTTSAPEAETVEPADPVPPPEPVVDDDAPPTAAPTPPPPAPPPPPAKVDEKPLFRFYGFIKPTIVIGTGVESFGNQNFSAPTAAAHPAVLTTSDDVGYSFQVAQSRLGLWIGEGLPVKGLLEFDFIDFGKSSPAQAALPRLRMGYVEWEPVAGQKLILGQLWDIFAPLNSFSYNFVGTFFEAGNVGFMRHQAIYSATLGGFEAAVALGLPTQNLTSILSNVEYGLVPTASGRVSYRLDKAWFGASAIGTLLRFGPDKSRGAWGANLFADMTYGGLSARAEAYGGSNLNNIGALAIGTTDGGFDAYELGGYASVKYVFMDIHQLHVGAGYASVLNRESILLGYQPATATSPATRLGTSGMERNAMVRVGYAVTAYKGLQLIAEPYAVFTRHKLAAADRALGTERFAWGVELGGLYNF